MQLPAPQLPAMDPAVAPMSLAAILETSVTRPQIGEWLQSPTQDIHARLVHFSSSLPSDGPSVTSYGSSPPRPRSSHRSLHTSSSMAPACIHQPSTASTHPPSLYNYSEATPTETSISTGLASQCAGVPLLHEVHGVLERRPNALKRPAFECAFWFLRCSYISDDQDEWRTHCLSHFRGEEPPKSVVCPLCSDFKFSCNDGFTSWNYRMDHVAYHHLLGTTLQTSRPDFHLFQHLWQKRLIDDQDLKELKGGNHNLTMAPANFTVTGNSRREREGRQGRQRHQHIGARRGLS
jgi:hypothetical protein